MNNIFKFDPVEHKYYLDDKEMPSVTRIIEPLNNFSRIHPDILQAKRQAGTDIHETIKLWFDGTLDETNLAEGNKIALDLFIAWFDGLGFGNLTEYEKPIYHKQLKYGGTPDLVFDKAIVDIKTAFSKERELSCAIQLSAYAKLFPDFPSKLLYILHLDIIKKRYQFINVKQKQGWSMFRFLYDYYKAGEKIKSWKRLS